MKSEADENQLGLWHKLNQLYGDNQNSAADRVNSPGAEDQGTGLEVDSLRAGRYDQKLSQPAGNPGFAGVVDSVNRICGRCDKSCKQPFGKFVETLCPLSAGERVFREQYRPEVSGRSVHNLEKINPNCSSCRRSCKQSGEKLNLMLCPGFEPIDSPPTGTKRGGQIEDPI